MRQPPIIFAVCSVCLGSLYGLCLATEPLQSVIQQAGIQGGIIVHIGCGDGKETIELHEADRFLVHGLDTSAAKVAEARERIRREGLYGQVSVDTFDGRTLPYIDNFANLVVADDLGELPQSEVERVLVPGGVACIKGTMTASWA